MNSPHAPALWCKGELHLVHKGGDPGVPANFRPIALTSTIGKLFHRIIASRLEQYLLNNGIIDSNLQKGFLSGIAGVFEHILSLNAILDNAKANGLPLSLTFTDLKNAFGSVPHKLISDMLHHVSVPMQIQRYAADVYTLLTATISTKTWCTPPFQITRGIFQGDTLSPLLFLLCFNPIIAYAKHSPSCGFQMSIQLPESVGLPPLGSHIYAEWREEVSNEPEGWYHCCVEEYKSDGTVVLRYRDGASETLNLHSINWAFARKSGKCFLPAGTNPPHYPLKKVREAAQRPKQVKSESHSVKAYADDVTLFSTSKEAHQTVLLELDDKCSEIGLQIHPD